MRIALMITVCEQNLDRIHNQIKNLQKHKQFLKDFNIDPYFVLGKTKFAFESSYKTLYVDVEEKYTNLYLKILEGFKKLYAEGYDYVIKIDDDTIFNIDQFSLDILSADYIGRFHSEYSENSIDIKLPMFNIETQIKFFPSIFQEQFKFATGDFYILSRRAILVLLQKIDSFKEKLKEEYVCEDQLVGFLLKPSVCTQKDIKLETNDAYFNVLQITKNCLSLHPIHTSLFDLLLNTPATKQLDTLLESGKISYFYRKSLIKKLESNLKQVLFDFVNSKKSMGLG